MSITRANILDTDIYALTAEKFSRGRTNFEVVRAMLAADVKLIQYREKEKKMGEKLAECRAIRALCAEAGAAFIVNDDVAIALLVDADGVHVGQEDLPVPEVRRLVGPEMAIGLSTHTPEQAREAVEQGADYIGVGPIFATQTKEDVVDPVGFEYLEWVAANSPLPFVAIGGIKERNIAEVVVRGARCVAMVTEIVEAEIIPERIARIRRAMRPAGR